MSEKKFALPKISFPKPDKEAVKKASVCGATLAAVAVSCALVLSGTNTLLSALVGDEAPPAASDSSDNSAVGAAIPSVSEEVAAK